MSDLDHKAQAQSRVYAEYRSKPKTLAWIGINGTLANQIESAYQSVANSYDIDNAGTDELNVIGRIVDISRSFEASISYETFQFGAAQFGGLGTQFRPLSGVTDQSLNNNIYRLLIKAKIAKNNSDATIDGILLSILEIVSTTNVTLVDYENMSFAISFDTLTDLEKLVLSSFDIVPKPQGVRFAGFIDGVSVSEFGRSQFGGSQFAFRFGG